MAQACTLDESSCLEDVILVLGKLDQGAIDSIDTFLKEGMPDTICFRTPGGQSDAAVSIGNWIRNNKINTCLAEKYIIEGKVTLNSTVCFSACNGERTDFFRKSAQGRYSPISKRLKFVYMFF
jgi:hypothetical protein